MATMMRLLSLCFGTVAASSHSFLQIGQDKRVLDLPQVLAGSKNVLDTLNAKVNSLQARLTEVQQEGAAAIEAQKAEYERKLRTQQESSTALAQKNGDTRSRVNALKEENLNLRSKAEILSKQGAKLTSDLQHLQANFSAAHEFVVKALDSSLDQLQKAPELQVLEELDHSDAESARLHDHESRLKQVEASLLQTRVDPGAHSILESLASSLDILAKEQNFSLESLKDSFDKEFQAGEKHQNDLLKEQAELNAAEMAELEKKEKLTAAVSHLEHTRESLLQKIQHIKSFAQRIGSRPEQ